MEQLDETDEDDDAVEDVAALGEVTSQAQHNHQVNHFDAKGQCEAKVAYLRCLRQQCCANTQWVDTAYAGGYTHTLTAPDDQGNIQNYGAGWWTDSSGVWQPPL